MLYDHCNVYYTAFFRLHTCRDNGMGMGNITYFMCIEYCKIHKFPYEEWDHFAEMILKMDDAYLQHVATEKPSKPEKDDPGDG